MIDTDFLRPMRGRFRLLVWRHGRIIGRMNDDNLVVDLAKTGITRLLGGDTTNRPITKFAVGTNGTAPAAGDTTITNVFVKAVDGVSYPTASSVRFAFSLTDAEANGLAILEFGLLTAGNVLYARKVRASALNKAADITISGTWTLSF